ncbi:MAG: hypothetical protein H0U95_09860 [Bacteroidetes bacterium]|nr:hypothetical protein [Bacteroidota bacterium]
MKITKKIFLSFVFYAQINLVPNPSFEDTIGGCPNNVSQLYKTKFWFNTNGSTDYFNKCYSGPFDYANIPKNSFGYQNTILSNCKAYCGILTYWPFNINTETLGIKLTDSLLTGTKYYFSIKISLANTKYATNNIGALFSTKIPSVSAVGSPPNFSNIKFNQVITDTLNWTSLFGNYLADSNYKYISIGNFYDASLTTTVMVNSGGTQGA